MDFHLAYCATCRIDMMIHANPPYAVIHINATNDEAVKHLHPLTREVL